VPIFIIAPFVICNNHILFSTGCVQSAIFYAQLTCLLFYHYIGVVWGFLS